MHAHMLKEKLLVRELSTTQQQQLCENAEKNETFIFVFLNFYEKKRDKNKITFSNFLVENRSGSLKRQNATDHLAAAAAE